MTWGRRNRSGVDSAVGSVDQRIVAWLTAPEGTSANAVLDRTFAQLHGVRQDRARPWSGLRESLSRPVAVRLPQWVWVALVLLLVLVLSLATLVGVDRLRPLFDRLSVLPAVPAQTSDVACPTELGAIPDVTCLAAIVPVRHERPGRTLTLPVAEFNPPSSGASRVASPPILVFDTFDPRGEQTRVDFRAWAETTGHGVIAIAPRGSARTDGSLRCLELEDVTRTLPATSLADDELRTALADAVRACRQRLARSGVDLEAYRLSQAAADLESIRAGMGVQTWIVRARGWDAELALELAGRYPASVAGVVLVNPVMAADEGQERHAAFDASVDELSSLCSSDSFCSVRYRSPKDAVASIEASLRAGGPQMVRVSSAGGGESDVPVDVELVHAAIRDAMAGYTSVGSVPSQLDRMASGVFTWPARRLMERGWCLGSDLACTGQNGWSGGGEFSMGCGVPQASSGATASKSDPIGLVCGAWLEGRGDEPTRTEVASDVPVEAFVGKVDPSTSAHRVRSALMGFGHATVAEIPWVPEGVEFACLRAVDRGWFEDPQEVSIVTCPSAGIPQFADAP